MLNFYEQNASNIYQIGQRYIQPIVLLWKICNHRGTDQKEKAHKISGGDAVEIKYILKL